MLKKPRRLEYANIYINRRLLYAHTHTFLDKYTRGAGKLGSVGVAGEGL